MAVEDSVAQDQLRAFIERIERMEEEKAAIAADIKEIYAEAKGNGFDTKILRKIVTIRKQDANERMEQEALLDLYMGALGMGGDVSSAYSENRRNSIADEIDEDLLTTVAETAKTPEGRKALMDAVAAHKNGSKLSQLRADPALAIVEAAKITPKTQPSQPADSDLTSVAPPEGQVAPLQPETANKHEASSASDHGQASAQKETASDEEESNSEPVRRHASTDSRDGALANDTSTTQRENGVSPSTLQPKYAEKGIVVWEHTPPEPVRRHPYSAAFGDLGQDMVVIDDDIAGAKSDPIVRIGNEILDGWARYNVARGMIGGSGMSTEYPVMQYAGTDPLLDYIRLNVAGRVLSPKDKQTVAQRLISIEPKRKAEILKAVAELAP
jgi:uncharacterized protein (UPF0335 family)